MVNIGETTQSNEIMTWRFWLKTEERWEIISQKFNGSISIIRAITSNEDLFVASANGKVNADTSVILNIQR